MFHLSRSLEGVVGYDSIYLARSLERVWWDWGSLSLSLARMKQGYVVIENFCVCKLVVI